MAVSRCSSGCRSTARKDVAAEYGCLEVAWWLHANRTEGYSVRAIESAARLKVLKLLHENRIQGFPSQMDRAAKNGRLGIVKFLHEHRVDGCTCSAMDGAAVEGHLEAVQWLHPNRTEHAMGYSASQDHLEIVRWLHEHHSEGCTSDVMKIAACHGHSQVVLFLHAESQRRMCVPWYRVRWHMGGGAVLDDHIFTSWGLIGCVNLLTERELSTLLLLDANPIFGRFRRLFFAIGWCREFYALATPIAFPENYNNTPT